MIEPTESEPMEELERFISAMLAIRAMISTDFWTALVNEPAGKFMPLRPRLM